VVRYPLDAEGSEAAARTWSPQEENTLPHIRLI